MRTTDLDAMPATRSLIARQGVSFNNAIATNPLCCPSRAVILSGQYNHNNGVQNNVQNPGNRWGTSGGYDALKGPNNTVATWLQAKGYRTAFVGKMLNGYVRKHKMKPGAVNPVANPTRWAKLSDDANGRPVPKGWTEWHASYGYGQYRYTDDGGVKGLEFQHKTSGFTSLPGSDRSGYKVHQGYRTSYEGKLAGNVIAEFSRRGEPWFLWWSSLAPHAENRPSLTRGGWCSPRPDPRDRNATFPGASQPNVSEPTADQSPLLNTIGVRFNKNSVGGCREKLGEYHANRLRSLRSLDREVGTLINQLKHLGQLDNTVIVFTSDNGFLLGEHSVFDKRWAYSESLEVPLLIRAPDTPRGKRIPQLVGLLDLPRTFLDYAASGPLRPSDTAGRTLDGVDLRNYYSTDRRIDPKFGSTRALLVEGYRPNGSPLNLGLRTRKFTYMVVQPGTRDRWVEVYDNDADPRQVKNLSKSNKQLTKQLAARYKQLKGCAGDGCRDW